MSTKLYDDALLAKIKYWCQDSVLTVFGVDETKRLFEVVADTTNDQPIKLPLVCISRPGGFNIRLKSKNALSYDALKLDSNYNKSKLLNAVPIGIEYQLDIYTRYYEEADEYIRNFVFNIINYPRISVNIPYNNENRQHNSSLRIAGEVEDNSEVPERLIKGQFTRLTLSLIIDDAYLWDVRIKDNWHIGEIRHNAENEFDGKDRIFDDIKDNKY